MKLRCKPGNYQCGKICISSARRCKVQASDFASKTLNELAQLINNSVTSESTLATKVADGKITARDLKKWQLETGGKPDAMMARLKRHADFWIQRSTAQEAEKVAKDTRPLSEKLGDADALIAETLEWSKKRGFATGDYSMFTHDITHTAVRHLLGVTSHELASPELPRVAYTGGNDQYMVSILVMQKATGSSHYEEHLVSSAFGRNANTRLSQALQTDTMALPGLLEQKLANVTQQDEQLLGNFLREVFTTGSPLNTKLKEAYDKANT